jgi:peroxiredoxin
MNIKQALGIVFILGLLFFGGWYWQMHTMVSAPDITFKTIKGESISLAKLKGKPVLVTFWATDCPGCIEEIPHLISLHEQFASRGLTIVAVAMDYDPPNHVLAMTEAKRLPYAVALDPTASHAQAFGHVRLTPTTFLIDRDGKIILHKAGIFNISDMQERLQHLL